MRIRSIFVTNYKNLIDCEVRPNLIHALTGCNGSGKTNFIQVLPFIAQLISGSDNDRSTLLAAHGWIPSRFGPDAKTTESFKFRLECEIEVNATTWVVEYSLDFTPFSWVSFSPKQEESFKRIKPLQIAREVLTAKELGKPGQNRTLIKRDTDGTTTLSYFDSRARPTFPAPGDLSVLKIIEVREGQGFAKNYPVIAAFRDSLIATDVLRLNAAKLIDNSEPFPTAQSRERAPGEVVDYFAPFELLSKIKESREDWQQYTAWMKILCGIEDIMLHTFELPSNDESKPPIGYNMILLRQHERFIRPSQLSTGHTMLFGILTALFTFLKSNGVILLEEPETYLHPKAIIDLLSALRETSQRTTVVISTHSPVLLNSLIPSEVTLMKPSRERGFFTTQPVGEIAEAIEQINRGYTSFGDMLQTNFTLDEAE